MSSPAPSQRSTTGLATPAAPVFLLVEDDDDHAMLIQRTMRRLPQETRVTRLADGEAALQYLRGESPYENQPRPDVILLDLNLPKYSGLEVLKAVKDDDRFAAIPVVVLTTSDASIDRSRAYQSRVNSFLVKPVDFGQFKALIEDLSRYWGQWNEPPVSAAIEPSAIDPSATAPFSDTDGDAADLQPGTPS